MKLHEKKEERKVGKEEENENWRGGLDENKINGMHKCVGLKRRIKKGMERIGKGKRGREGSRDEEVEQTKV